jgi:3-methyladenine DNA glycosylase AlkD
MKEVKDYLIKNRDPKYKDFSLELNLYHKYKSIGVRIPVIRSLAKDLSKKYSLDYLINNIDEEYYEEILLKGFIIGNYKNLTYDELIKHIDNHLPKVSDWSMCDTFVASLKITNKYKNELWKYLNNKLKSKNEYGVRFALVMILNYYIEEKYKDDIYKIIESVKLNTYYVKMANAWLLSYMIIEYFDESINFIKNTKMDSWTISKGITKAIESRRITELNKDKLRELRNIVKEQD